MDIMDGISDAVLKLLLQEVPVLESWRILKRFSADTEDGPSCRCVISPEERVNDEQGRLIALSYTVRVVLCADLADSEGADFDFVRHAVADVFSRPSAMAAAVKEELDVSDATWTADGEEAAGADGSRYIATISGGLFLAL